MTTSPSMRNAFKDALTARIDALVQHIVADLQSDSEDLAALRESVLTRTVHGQVEQLFGALEGSDASPRVASLSALFEEAVTLGVPPEALLGALQSVRRHLLDASLSLLNAGVPGTREGLRLLMNLLDESAMVLHQASWAKARAIERQTHILKTLADRSTYGVAIANMQGRFLYTNPAYRALLGYDNLDGVPLRDVMAPDDRERAPEIARAVIEGGQYAGRIRYMRADGSTFSAHLTAFLAKDERGVPIARCAFVRDLTEEDRAEAEKLALKEQVIEGQKRLIQQLSTPLLPVAKGVLLLPVIGAIDGERATAMLVSLVDAISVQSARIAIVDITGVESIDTRVADALGQMAGAVRLMGAQMILTGIRPRVAKVLTDLGVGFDHILVLSTLAAGVDYALRLKA